MRIVALEEHFAVPSLLARIDPRVIAARGYPEPGMPWSPTRKADAMQDLGTRRIADMDAGGITLQVLSMTGPGADLVAPRAGPAWAREANDTLAAAVRDRPDRLAGFAHLPMTAPDAAADELERAVTLLGFRGALVNGTTGGRFLDHASFEPILTRAEALDVPIYIHPGVPPQPVRDAYYGGLPDELSFLLSIAGWGWHAETALHVLRLALSGTLDRHPRLKLIIGHMGEGLPAMMARCDQVFGDAATRFTSRKLSETLLDHLHVTTSGFFTLPPFLALLSTFGVERIMFSVDYPFSSNLNARPFLKSLPVDDADRMRIAHGNADTLLRLAV